MPPHIVVDISGHGFGHAAMTLPVLDSLITLRPDLRVTVRSSLPEPWLRARSKARFGYAEFQDVGMAMVDSLRVSVRQSFDHYVAFHRDWPLVVAEAAEEMKSLRPDLLVSNVSYLSLAAARHIGIDCVAYSSLNWADVFWEYCGRLPGAADVMRQMVGAYGAAKCFLQPEPSMPMPSIPNGQPTPPVARVGLNRRVEIIEALRLAPATRLALISMGGIATPIDYRAWPRLPGWRVIIGGEERADHADVSSWSDLEMPFIDVLASVDVTVIKPGYGLITESVCNGKPVLYVPRDRWPETPAEIAWLERHGGGERIEECALRAGEFVEAAERMADARLPPPPTADGAAVVAKLLIERL